MPGRRHARRRAIDILYQADVTGASATAVLSEWAEAGREIDPFTREVVIGVTEHRGELDTVIDEHSEGWRIHRLASVDRAILRVACEELLFRHAVPVSVAVSEAVEAAKELSTEDSSRFVNGVLGRIAEELREPGSLPE